MRYLIENMKKRFTWNSYAKYTWLAARAYTVDQFNKLMGKVIEAHLDVVPTAATS